MLAMEAARLAAIEVLAPTAELVKRASGDAYTMPTLAGSAIFDSRAIAVADIDRDKPFTPAVSVYGGDMASTERGEAAAYDDYAGAGVLEFVSELAVVTRDAEGEFADAMAASDGEARMVLAALVAQVEFALMQADSGHLFRRFAVVNKVSNEVFAIPQLGMRYQRVTTRMDVSLKPVIHSDEDGILPEPMETLFGLLPVQSYARGRIAALRSAWRGQALTPLEGIDIAGTTPGEPIGTVDFGD